MASTTWHKADFGPGHRPPVEETAQVKEAAGRASLGKVFVRRRGQRPLEFLGVHLLRIAGPEVDEGHIRHHADLYQTVEGGYAVSLLQERDGMCSEIGAFKGREWATLLSECADVDPLASLPSTAWRATSRGVDLSVPMKAALMQGFFDDVRSNFEETLQRLSSRLQAD